MIGFLLKRLAWGLLTLWIVFTLSFILMQSVPGGPFDAERNLTPDIKRNIEARYNLDKHPVEQYFIMLFDWVRLDFGPSYKLADYTVGEILAEGFPVSASLGIFALVFAIVLGLTAGIISALRRNTWLDTSFMGAATLGIAVPNFVLASLAIMLFVFIVPLFPAGGWGRVGQIVLPALCLGAPYAAYVARLTRTGLMETLGQDYIRTAFAKGLMPRRVVVKHALRGAILPVVSFLGPAIAGILTGSLVLEKIFALPGMGSHFIDAANQRDYPLAMGVVMTYTFLVFIMNTLVDVSYAVIDPRVKL